MPGNRPFPASNLIYGCDVDDGSGRSRSLLDLSDARLNQLMGDVGELAVREIRATQHGQVFAQRPESSAIRQALAGNAPLPRAPEEFGSVLESAATALALGRRSSPRFFGYVFSPANPVAIAADTLASATDQNVTSWRSAPSGTEIEWVTLRWLAEFTGFGSDVAGLFVSGGSLAHLTVAFIALRARGPDEGDRRRLSMFVSDQAHFSIDKAAAALGVNLRRVATDEGFRMEPKALREALAADREQGNRPFCVVATAGTTPTGAVDPLTAVADIAAAEDAWFHVDGAYGAPAAATRRAASLFAGIELADSLSIDAHKWLYVPVDCSALLLRDPNATRGAFGPADDYVKVLQDQPEETFAFWDHGFELSRRSRALKLWMTFKAYGADALARSIEEDIELADLMGQLVRDADDLELVCEPSLSVCCFRHRPAGVADEDLNAHNEALLTALQRDGRAYLSNVTVAGRFALRACITNFRTTSEDVRETIRLVQRLGDAVSGGS